LELRVTSSQIIELNPGQGLPYLPDPGKQLRFSNEHASPAVIDRVPKQVWAEPNVEWYSNRANFKAGIIAQNDLQTVWQQERNSVSWIDPLRLQGDRQTLRKGTEVSVGIGPTLKDQRNIVRILGTCVVQKEIQHVISPIRIHG
jgi:hypothetical protein